MRNIIFTDDILTYIDNNKDNIVECMKDNEIEINDDNIESEAQSCIEFDYEDFISNIELFDKHQRHSILVVGTCGLWYGNVKGGEIYKDLVSALRELYEDINVVFFDKKNTTLRMESTHHDGTNEFKFYELTDRGEEYILNNEYRMSRRNLHERLLKNGYCKAITSERLYGVC